MEGWHGVESVPGTCEVDISLYTGPCHFSCDEDWRDTNLAGDAVCTGPAPEECVTCRAGWSFRNAEYDVCVGVYEMFEDQSGTVRPGYANYKRGSKDYY